MRRHIAVAAIAVAITTGCAEQRDATTGATSRPARNPAELSEDAAYAPTIRPDDFVESVDNPYMPLQPGTKLRYEGTSDGEKEETVVEVTDRTKDVMGVQTTVVRDRVYVDGELVEDTLDWFAQDSRGNVWYFGEESKDIEDGEVASTEGSWEAGVDGAHPGIVMLADPRIGDTYRQEFYEGEAEDAAKVIALDETVEVEAGSYEGVLVTEDWNPLEPNVLERKYYAKGVGLVQERLVEGGQEQLELVEITPAR